MTKLLVLGLLDGGPMSGYDLQQKLGGADAERWGGVLPGSIYHALKKLEVEGYQELKLKLVSEMVQNIRVNQLLSKEPITEKSTFPDIIHTLPKLYDKAITDT